MSPRRRPAPLRVLAAVVPVVAVLCGCGGPGPAPSGATTAGATDSATGAGPAGSPSVTGSVSAAAPTSSAPGTSARTPTPSASGRATASTAAASPGRSAPGAQPYVRDPVASELDFGFVVSARRKGQEVLLEFDRAGFLTGTRAEAYYADHPDEEPLDFAIVNDRSLTRTMRVRAGATLFGQDRLGDGDPADVERITAAQLVRRVGAAPGGGVAVWLRHDGDIDAPVVYLAEQYLP